MSVVADDITPQQAMKLADYSPSLSVMDRRKIIALALPRSCDQVIEMKVCWEFSMYVIKHLWGQDIGPFDPEFVNDINADPRKYRDD